MVATREEFISTGPGAPPADLDIMSAEQRGYHNFQRMLRAFRRTRTSAPSTGTSARRSGTGNTWPRGCRRAAGVGFRVWRRWNYCVT